MTDTFRKEYKSIPDDHSDLILTIKDMAEIVELNMRRVSNREMSIALTNLETAIMWATKAIVIDAEKGSNND